MPIPLPGHGPDVEISVEVNVDGMLTLVVRRDGYRMAYEMPSLTPFEASMLARDLNRAAERADIASSAKVG